MPAKTALPRSSHGDPLFGLCVEESTQRLQCSYFLAMTYYLTSINILPKRVLHLSLWVRVYESEHTQAGTALRPRGAEKTHSTSFAKVFTSGMDAGNGSFTRSHVGSNMGRRCQDPGRRAPCGLPHTHCTQG